MVPLRIATQFIVPNPLVPILAILSGLLVACLGVRLIGPRWRTLRRDQSHTHEHDQCMEMFRQM